MDGLRLRVAEVGGETSRAFLEQPVGRLQSRGAGAPTTVELLAVVMGPAPGRRGRACSSLEDKAGRLLATLGSLRALATVTVQELMVSCGLGVTCAARVAAVVELARRFSEEEVRTAEALCGAEEAYRFLKPRLRDLPHEVFAVIFLNQKHGVLAYRELFRGTVSASAVHPREVVKEVLKENAAAVILAHNHPSGHVSPSPDDLRLTEELRGLLRHLDVRVLDHLIVGGNGYFSFAREGLLNG